MSQIAAGSRSIDCDVHCAVPSTEAIAPYLSEEHWRDHVRITQFSGPGSLALTYPSWHPMLATDGAAITVDSVRSTVLRRSEIAIMQCFYGLESMTHPYLGPALARAVNCWLQREWLDADERLLGSIVVTPQRPAAAAEEIARTAADERFVQVLLPARVQQAYGDQRYWPIWEAAEAHGLPIAITFGGGMGLPPTPANWPSSFFEDYVVGTLGLQSHVTSLVVEGVFQRFPNLEVALFESGVSWLPPLLWRMDQNWKAVRTEAPWLKEAPSAYVRRHIKFGTAPLDLPSRRAHIPYLLEQLWSDELLLYCSDSPHRYEETFDELASCLDAEALDRVLWRNAFDLYRLERFVADGPEARQPEIVS
jgi:predicted TIM-barrel fold metal-dependent hydrolase